MTPEMAEACRRAIHVVTADGQVLRAGRAAMFLLQHLGYPRLGKVGSWYPFVWFVELGYFVVARNRGRVYRWFFRKFCQKQFALEHEHQDSPPPAS